MKDITTVLILGSVWPEPNSSAAGINFHCAPSGTTASSTTLKGYLRVNQTGTCLLLGVFPTAFIIPAVSSDLTRLPKLVFLNVLYAVPAV